MSEMLILGAAVIILALVLYVQTSIMSIITDKVNEANEEVRRLMVDTVVEVMKLGREALQTSANKEMVEGLFNLLQTRDTEMAADLSEIKLRLSMDELLGHGDCNCTDLSYVNDSEVMFTEEDETESEVYEDDYYPESIVHTEEEVNEEQPVEQPVKQSAPIKVTKTKTKSKKELRDERGRLVISVDEIMNGRR